MLPPLFLQTGVVASTLCSSPCISMTRDSKTNVVCITAHRGNDYSMSCAIDGLIESTNGLLDENKAYKVLWDLRQSETPSLQDTARLVSWGASKKRELSALTVKMGVIVPDGPVANIAGSVITAFSGGVPTMVSSNVDKVKAYVKK